MQTQNIKKFTNLFLHYSFYIPIITFLALYVVRVFYLGQFHDDWDLFRAGNIKSFNDTLLQFHDRPIIGLLFYGVNIFWNGSPVILSCLSSLLVAITAVLLFRFLKSISTRRIQKRVPNSGSGIIRPFARPRSCFGCRSTWRTSG